MATQCLTCVARSRYRSRLCLRHTQQLRDLLNPWNEGRPEQDVAASVPVLWAKLDATPGKAALGSRGAPGYQSRPAADLHVADLRGPVRGTLEVLVKRVDAIMDVFNPVGPWRSNGHWFAGDHVRAICAYLTYRFDELLTYEHVDEVLSELLELSDQLREVVGDGQVRSPGRCIDILKGRECLGQLELVPPGRDPESEAAQAKVVVARCPRCYRRYTWLDLLRLRYIQGRV